MNGRRSVLALAAFLGFAWLAVPAWADGPEPRTITVVGTGHEEGAPDTARLQFSVEHTAPTARAAGQAAAKTATDLLAVLKKEAGEGARVTTAGYSLNPVYEQIDRMPPGRPQQPKIVGYTASQDVSVETKRIETVGPLIDAATTAGAARIGSLVFSIADPAPLMRRALASATADAGAQAAAIADALKVRVVEVLEASTEGGAMPRPERFAKVMAADSMMATPIEPGAVTTDARLRVTYRIE